MRKIEIETGLGNGDIGPATFYVAGFHVVTDVRLPEYGAYAASESLYWSRPETETITARRTDEALTYAGKGWIGNAWRKVECRRMPSGYVLRIEGIGGFRITADGQRAVLDEAQNACPEDLLARAALGAPLILALALQGVYCLHAAFVRAGERPVAIAGESGQGKSTLAQFLSSEKGRSWQRIGDDILPLQINGSGELRARPHFPQQKLAPAEQPVVLAPADMSLTDLYVLEKGEEQQADGVQIEPLSPRATVMAAVQHTVAARLFDRQLLGEHLAFCESLAVHVRARRLRYPQRLDRLPAVSAALAQDLGFPLDGGSVRFQSRRE